MKYKGAYMITIALDIETSGVDWLNDSIVSISFYCNGKNKFLLLYHNDNLMPNELGFKQKVQAIIDKSDLVIMHNAQFDMLFLKKLGVSFDNVNIYDTMIGEYILTAQEAKFAKLDELSQKYLNDVKIEVDIANAEEIPVELLEQYNNKDTELTFKVYQKQIAQMNSKMYKLVLLHSNFSKVLVDISYNGFKIDVAKLNKLKEDTKNKISKLESEMMELLERNINLNSSPQLSAALFGGSFEEDGFETVIKHYKKGDKEVRRKTRVSVELEGLGFSTRNIPQCKAGHYSTSIEVIKKLKPKTKKQRDFLDKYLEYNELNSLYEKYLDKYSKYITDDGFVHAHFNQCSTNTGRLSCSNPNIQQIPRTEEVKSIFISRWDNGYIVDVDLKQLEWRICAFLCQDDTMISEIENGVDAHISNASLAFDVPEEEVTKELRQIAKAVSFGLIYGQTFKGMAKRFEMPEEEAKKIIDTIYTKYPKLKQWHDELYFKAVNTKKVIIPSGRYFKFLLADKEITKIKNYPVQAFSCGDIVPLMIYKIWLKLKHRDDVKIINTVHDCLVLDCKDENVAKEIADFVVNMFRLSPKIIGKFFGVNFNVKIDADKKINKSW